MKEKKKKINVKNSQLSSFFQLVKELFKDPKGRALLFFGFYFIFFLFLGISFRMAPHTSSKRKINIPSTISNTMTYSLDKILAGNYQFTYQEETRGIVKHFSGSAYDKMKKVTSSFNELYFLYSGIVIKREDNTWRISENPFSYRQIMEEAMIEETLKGATFISKTVYQNNETLYRYQIATTTLWWLYQKEQIDLADAPNTIELLTTEKGEIKTITYDYSPYATYLFKEPTVSKIEVGYQNYGKVDAFSVPN